MLDHLSIQGGDLTSSAALSVAAGAFVRDPEGNNLEALGHTPE